MSEIIPFPAEAERQRRAAMRVSEIVPHGATGGHEAEILFFTGIRYSRAQPAEQAGAATGYREMEKAEG